MKYKEYEYYEFIDTATKQKVLEFLRKNHKKKVSVKEISEELKIPQASVSRALTDLEKLGLLHSIEEGKFKYFNLDTQVFDHISKIFNHLEHVKKFTLEQRHKGKTEAKE